EKLLVGGRVPAGVAVGLGGQGDDGGDHFGSVAAAEGGGLGALQIRQQIVGDGRQIVLPQRRIACRLAGGIPHYLLHCRDATDCPRWGNEAGAWAWRCPPNYRSPKCTYKLKTPCGGRRP